MKAAFSLLEILTSNILQNAPNDPKLNSEMADTKSTLHMQYIGPQVSSLFHP